MSCCCSGCSGNEQSIISHHKAGITGLFKFRSTEKLGEGKAPIIVRQSLGNF